MDTPPLHDEILVPAEICSYLRITRAKFYYLASRGRLGFLFKVGNEWRARRTDLGGWIQENTSVAQAIAERKEGMADQAATVTIDEVHALLGEEGYEVMKMVTGVLRIKDVESGIVALGDLQDNILFFTVSCMVLGKSSVTSDLMHRLLDGRNGINTSAFRLHERPDGNVAITLNNFCKLQEMGEDDRDDIVSCLEFLVMDVCAASEMLQPMVV